MLAYLSLSTQQRRAWFGSQMQPKIMQPGRNWVIAYKRITGTYMFNADVT